ncbi:MAG: ATP synthase F1 subunit gamma [Bacteroidota bacterium]|nr:ATP synthase F1 subunit gamma [Bacteroidota bacterium]MDP4194413.1 ATP synthase F1 subunit gamma [Bacteroidota bacterium]
MATLRDIKRRIIGVKSTQQITKAMKMVAAAKLRRAQENMLNARPYSKKISEVLSNLLELGDFSSNPLLSGREVKSVAVVVVTSDRGLAGSFNMNAIREATNLIHGELEEFYKSGNLFLYCLGKKGCDHFSGKNYKISGLYPGVFSSVKFQTASNLVSELKHRYLNNEIDKVIIVYNEFKSVMQQNVIVEQFLPIPSQSTKKASDSNKKPGQKMSSKVDFIYEPDESTIINSLLPRHLNSQMWKVMLESFAAELGARMTAMDLATENAKELIRTLQLTYNKARQAAITTELSEIVSGANALKAD